MRWYDYGRVLELLQAPEYGKTIDGTIVSRLKQLFPLAQMASQCLPASWQPLPALFVATYQQQLAGVIWLQRETGHRWRIEQLILHPEFGNLTIGEHLLEYAIHRFGGTGVEQFLARVSIDNDEALSLLKQANFRQLDRRYDYQWTGTTDDKLKTPAIIDGLREALPKDSHNLQALFNETLSPTTRPYLSRTKKMFGGSISRNLIQKISSGRYSKRWLVESFHASTPTLLGMVQVFSDNYQQFHIEVITSPGWQDGYAELIQHAIAHCHQHTSTPDIFLHQYGQQHNPEVLTKTLGFTCQRELLLLIKDYWKPIKLDKHNKQASPLLLVGGEPSAV